MGLVEKISSKKYALSLLKIIFDLKTPRFNDIKRESFKRDGAANIARVLKWLQDEGFVEKFEDQYMLSDDMEDFCDKLFTNLKRQAPKD